MTRGLEGMRTLLVAALLVPPTVIMALIYIAFGLFAPGGRVQRALEDAYYEIVLRTAGVRVEARGLDRLRPGTSYVIMPNHRSWIDIPVLHRSLSGRDIRWVGKREIVPVPFFGWAFGLSRHIVIDRANREKSVAAIRRATAVGRGGVSIVIFPEGTRSMDGALQPFKKGGFHMAIDAGLDILPVAVAGTERVLPKHAWTVRPGDVVVTFCDPVPPPAGGKRSLPLLMEAVRERIRTALPAPHGPAAAPAPANGPGPSARPSPRTARLGGHEQGGTS